MIKLKSTNLLYMIGILPLWTVAIVSGMLLVGTGWVQVLLGIVGAYLFYFVVKKFLFLPRPKAEYSDLVPLAITVPGKYHVALFTSERMAQYEFLNRSVEVISPFTFAQDAPVQIVVNPQLLKEQGERFVQVSVMREIENYRNKSHLKNILGLLVPLLLLVVFVEWFFLLQIDLSAVLGIGVLTYVGPFAGVVAILLILMGWNKSVSYQDRKVDQILLGYFPRQDVAKQIEQSEAAFSKDAKENQRPIYQHYTQERIDKLALKK